MGVITMKAATVFVLVCGLVGAWGPAGAAENEDGPARLYHLDVPGIEATDAAQLLKQRCYEADWRCTMKWSNNDWLTVWAPPAAHEWFAARVAEWGTPPPPPQTLVFKLYLLWAQPGSGPAPRLAPGAAAALEDLMEFLPPSSFELRGSGAFSLQPNERAQTVLAGSEGYRAHLRFSENGGSGTIRVEFSLNDLVAATDEAGNRTLRSVDVLDNAFGMEVGETIVVGTSEAGRAGESLIVLLSAEPS